MSRIRFDAPENALAQAARGRAYIDLTESNPTQAGFVYEDERILRALSRPECLMYQPTPRGLADARAAVAAYARVSVEQVLLTASTSEAYALLFKLLCDPGDAVLVPEPSYPLFDYLTALEGVRAAPYTLRWDGEWHVDHLPRGDFKAALAVSPGNPTGAYLSARDHEKLSSWPLIVDEVFADYAFGERPALTPARGLRFRLSGLSKVCGLPQLKLGWIVAEGEGARDALRRLELIADTYLSVSTPVQVAARELLDTRHAFQTQVRARTAQNLATLLTLRDGDAAWDVLRPDGGWTAVLSVPRSRSEDEWALMLLDAGVLVHPGYFFDFPSGAHLVVSLLPRPEEFAKAAVILARTLARR